MRLLNFIKLTEAKLRGPHQNHELELMLSGTKPLALLHLELRDPEEQAQWEDAVRSGTIIHKIGPSATKGYDDDYFALPGEEWRIDKAVEIFTRVQQTKQMPDDAHRALGKLLGYSDEAIDYFINTPISTPVLYEAPVRDFEVDPSINQYYHGTWSRRDQAMLGNPKMADIVTKRIKTGIPIDMHFAGVIQMDRSEKWMSSHSQTAGRMTDKFREVLQDESGVSSAKAVSRKWGVDIVPAKDAITVLYMSNTNDVSSAIPFTPWIMTHRLGHSLDDAAQANQLGSAASGARSLMEEIVVGNDEYTDLAQPISSFMTMKSARTTSLDEGEEIPELLAQYIYEGRIRLARYVHQSGRNHFKLSNGLTGDTLISNHPDSEDGNEMNKRIENVEQQLNEMAETIVTAAIGLLVVAP